MDAIEVDVPWFADIQSGLVNCVGVAGPEARMRAYSGRVGRRVLLRSVCGSGWAVRTLHGVRHFDTVREFVEAMGRAICAPRAATDEDAERAYLGTDSRMSGEGDGGMPDHNAPSRSRAYPEGVTALQLGPLLEPARACTAEFDVGYGYISNLGIQASQGVACVEICVNLTSGSSNLHLTRMEAEILRECLGAALPCDIGFENERGARVTYAVTALESVQTQVVILSARSQARVVFARLELEMLRRLLDWSLSY